MNNAQELMSKLHRLKQALSTMSKLQTHTDKQNRYKIMQYTQIKNSNVQTTISSVKEPYNSFKKLSITFRQN